MRTSVVGNSLQKSKLSSSNVFVSRLIRLYEYNNSNSIAGVIDTIIALRWIISNSTRYKIINNL